MENKREMNMSDDLKGWGVGLLIMGGVHFFVPLLAPQWGIILIVLGILSLFVRHRGMFIALGASLIGVGLLNLIGSMDAGGGFWSIFGCLQIYWGIKEMIKFGKYRKEQEVSPIKDLETVGER